MIEGSRDFDESEYPRYREKTATTSERLADLVEKIRYVILVV